MRVKMLTTYAGPAGSCAPGKTIDLPEAQAKGLIDGGYAELVGETGAEKPRRGRPAGSRSRSKPVGGAGDGADDKGGEGDGDAGDGGEKTEA
jgi:hypothetical protein